MAVTQQEAESWGEEYPLSGEGSDTPQNPVRDFEITQKSIDFSDFIEITTDFIYL